MRNIITLLKKELWSFFVSPVAYCVVTGFVLLSAYLFFSYLYGYNTAIMKIHGHSAVSAAAVTLNGWVIEHYARTIVSLLLFVIPLLTMRVFAEEKKRGTFEMLLTSPLSIVQIVLGKYLAVAVIVIIMLLIAYLLPFSLYTVGLNPEIVPILVGMFGVILAGLSFIAVAMIGACFSENQIITGAAGLTLLVLLYVIVFPAQSLGSEVEAILKYLSPGWQVHEFIQGVFSIKGCVYFITLTFFGLFVTKRFLDTERWR